MKYKSIITALLLTTSASLFADGGGPRNTSYFSYYERDNNLFYSSVEGKVRLKEKDKKGKPVMATATANIAIYSVASKSTTYIFDTATFKGSVVDLHFEQYYDAAKQVMWYNQSTNSTDYSPAHIDNNFNIPKREASNTLIIKTYSFDTQTFSLWTCDKLGKNLKKVYDLENDANMTWHIDVFNRCIRVLKNGEHRNEVTEIKY